MHNKFGRHLLKAASGDSLVQNKRREHTPNAAKSPVNDAIGRSQKNIFRNKLVWEAFALSAVISLGLVGRMMRNRKKRIICQNLLEVEYNF